MSQSGQRTALGSFTIAVNRVGSDKSSQMTLQHIVKPTAAEKISDTILVTDLDIIKFITFLVTDIQYDIGSDQVSYQLPDTDITEALALEERMWQTAIIKIYNKLSRTSQTEIKFTVHPHSTPFLNELPGHLWKIKAPASLDFGDPISDLDKIPPLTIEDAISDVDPLPKRNIDIEQQDLLADVSSPRAVKGWRWALVVSAILSSLFLFSLDNTIVADIQPAIAETFEDVGELPWLGVAFLLGAASTNLVSIFLSDGTIPCVLVFLHHHYPSCLL
jgi:hypothetical protein